MTNTTQHPTSFDAVMIDTETLGTKPGSVIYQIAAVEFNTDTFHTGREIELNICPLLSHHLGLTIDITTLQWHRDKGHTPPENARQDNNVLHPQLALTTLTTFLEESHAEQYWCKSTSFDFPLLEAVYRATDMEKSIPWKYYQQYDMRTLWNLAFPGEKTPEADHTALADCHAQIEQLAAANDRIIDHCIEGITDGQLIHIARKRATPKFIHGTPLPQMPRHPSVHTFYYLGRNIGKTALTLIQNAEKTRQPIGNFTKDNKPQDPRNKPREKIKEAAMKCPKCHLLSHLLIKHCNFKFCPDCGKDL